MESFWGSWDNFQIHCFIIVFFFLSFFFFFFTLLQEVHLILGGWGLKAELPVNCRDSGVSFLL